ncbi:MAG TPA: TauD/TfdA family dioxygenase [Caulobacteraceae bacterium]|jgi:gamma-butyrobetaine dioxygenase|nr:TauD/TfdA family dioxygenase [Caulobacteraceae bacterium]
MNAEASLAADGRRIRVTWPDGVSRDIPGRWLFDHADDARDAVSGQRSHGALALDGVRVEAAEVGAQRLEVRFSTGERRLVSLGRLRVADSTQREIALWPTPDPIVAAASVAFDDYLGDDGAAREVLSRVARFGLAVMVGAGREPDVVERAVARFGFVRETNYGRLFDVRIEPQPGNLAYTDQALDLHADNPYRDPVPTLQLLHAIIADEAGGETLFVDGFAQAEALRRDAPDAFETLARTPVRFTFAADTGERWSHVAPVLSLAADGGVETVRLNHRSLDLAPGEAGATDAWYDAYLAFYRRLHAPEAAYGRKLAPGEVVIFDNRRLLHGRRALTSGSARWLRGCYADVDGLAATLARFDRASAASETTNAA